MTHLSGLEQQVAGAAAAFRATLRSLARPDAPSGTLSVALAECAAAFTKGSGVPAHVLVLGTPTIVGEAREEILARVLQEGLRNVERHAGATEVVITLAYAPDGVELVVQDDGVGPRVRATGAGVGLGLIREEVSRLGGDIRLTRGEDTGTTMRTRIPL